MLHLEVNSIETGDRDENQTYGHAAYDDCRLDELSTGPKYFPGTFSYRIII